MVVDQPAKSRTDEPQRLEAVAPADEDARRDPTVVDRDVGRRGFLAAAAEGALTGALVAGLLGMLLGLLNWVEPLQSSIVLGLYGLGLGALFGGAVGLAGHSLMRRERDAADEARRRLSGP